MDGIIDSMDMSLSKLWEIVKDWEAWSATVHRVTKELDITNGLTYKVPNFSVYIRTEGSVVIWF